LSVPFVYCIGNVVTLHEKKSIGNPHGKVKKQIK